MRSDSPTHDDARFVWHDQDVTCYEDLETALCALETEQDAAEFWNAYVEFLSRPTARLGGRTPIQAARENLAYLTSLRRPEESRRIHGLFVGHDFGGREDSQEAGAGA